MPYPGFSWDHVIGIKNTQNIRVVYGIKNDVWEAGIGKPLFYASGLYESYEAMGINPKNADMHLILHGEQVTGYSTMQRTENPRTRCWAIPTNM